MISPVTTIVLPFNMLFIGGFYPNFQHFICIRLEFQIISFIFASKP
ncbi:hypothetical protein HMPREF0971_01581 [Segatella oris F0302]|uniref:Uncharacterized protein n=1 Tax=Segatella oris F0302 TaxID=649760 RepID=D1QRH5_9BACT|nr:hypothetical protein HMPREF0971_01581 [Segatella oris F0302]